MGGASGASGASAVPRAPQAPREPLLAAFAAQVRAAASDHRQLAGWDDIIVELAAGDRHDPSDRRVVLAPSLVAVLPDLVARCLAAGLDVIVPDGEDPAAAIADAPVGVVLGELAVAETGSVLVREHALGDRVVTMLCHRLIQVVHADDVVARLDDVAVWLAAHAGSAAFVSLMTGPSRTADIERSLTIGVQGPEEVGVRVLTDPRGADPRGAADPVLRSAP
jgi:L-lactate dehydrogenase complex protein LldG